MKRMPLTKLAKKWKRLSRSGAFWVFIFLPILILSLVSFVGLSLAIVRPQSIFVLVGGILWFSFVIYGVLVFLLSLIVMIFPELVDRSTSSRKVHMEGVPGTRLLALVDFLFRPTTVELTFKPLIGEWHAEYFEALYKRRTMKARWITIRYRFAFACTFIMAVGLSKMFSLFKQVSK